ncbi:MAG: prepilin peptidase [Desulfobulbaceae bacterium]|nr:prepilin peptidase [Desulfobulbaceae bacterium]
MTESQLTVLTIFSALLGAAIGSFLNVVILRLPKENASIVFPASHCPGCQTPLAWYDNIPIFSFLLLRARCRNCGMRISWQYPLVEAAMALLAVALFNQFGPTWVFGIYFLFCAALLAIFVIDLHHQIIPDVISLPGIVIGFALSFLNPLLTWQSAAIGILTGGGILYLIAAGYYLFTKREGMGGGDIKLLAMIGAFLGWQALPFVVFASSILGSLIGIVAMIKQKKGGKTVIPYGPFLALAAVSYLFFQPEIKQLFDALFLPPRP